MTVGSGIPSLYVIQHTDSEYLGQVEDHLEGRSIGFKYMRPHTGDGTLPATVDFTLGMIVLGGGPWGAAGGRDLPTLDAEVDLVRRCMERGTAVIGIGLGAQILAIASGGGVEAAALAFEVTWARRLEDGALKGHLPERYPLCLYMRDRPLPPPGARVLAEDDHGRPALFQVGGNCFGFTGHPGVKVAMIEDLIMEFTESPEDPTQGLEELRAVQGQVTDALVPIMTGLIQITGWMSPRE